MSVRPRTDICPPHLQECAQCYARLPPEDMDAHFAKHHPAEKKAETREQRRKKIFNVVSDLVGRFLYYDRKEDEDLPVNAINDMVEAGDITVNEMVDAFAKGLRASLG